MMFDPAIVFSLLILIAVAFTALRTGRANPVDTGTLKQSVDRLEVEVKAIRKDLDEQPSAADFAALHGDLRALSATLQGVQKSQDKMDAGQVRIEKLLMEAAFAAPKGRS